MSFTESIKICFQKYIDFSGRASRSEYWWFTLFTVIVQVLTFWIPFLGFIIALALLLPSLAVTARRLHDTNRTGWWMLFPIGLGLAGIIAGAVLVFIVGALGAILIFLGPVIGFVTLLAFLIQPSDPGANQYGPNPLQPNMGMGGYGYAGPGDPYAPTPLGGTATEADPEPSGRLYCSQCGAERQPDARFCIVCGANF